MQPSKSIAVQAATSTEKDPQPLTFDDDFEEVKEDIRSSSFNDNSDASHDDQSSVIPFDGMLFTSWKDITNAVHSEALSQNKQVSCTASLSGSKKKVYKCVHYLGCAKRHVQEVRDWACETYPDDEIMRAECMKLNPFVGRGACNYSVVAYWNKHKGFYICSKSSNFSHNRY